MTAAIRFGDIVLQRNPLVLYIQTAPLPIRFHMTEPHKRRIRHRHELKEQHKGYAAEEAG